MGNLLSCCYNNNDYSIDNNSFCYKKQGLDYPPIYEREYLVKTHSFRE